MSLRNYLFYLIGGLILLLSTFQVAFIFWAQNNFEQQVQEKAEEFSLRVLDVAVDNFDYARIKVLADIDNSVPPSVKNHFIIETDNLISTVTIENLENKEQPVAAKMVYVTKEMTSETIDINDIKNTLHKSVIKLHKEIKNNQENHLLDSTNKGSRWEFIGSTSINKASKLDEFVNIVLIVILVSTLITLAFAFWLSGKFSQPMQALSLGFRQLAKGDYGNNINEQGVEETRQTIRDFNAMKARLQQLSITEKQLQQQGHLAELGEVSLGLAHALRNPIHTIGLSVEQLNSDAIDSQQRQHFTDKIQAKIKHIDKTIRALLTLTTTGINRNNMIKLLPIIQDIILEYKAGDNLALTFTINVNNKIKIMASDTEIRAILHTLIINACEASNNEQSINISAISEHDLIKVSIQDQGEGISNKVAEKLFQPHVTSKPEGAGMGLYIAQRLVKLFYQGQITLTNQSSGGCLASVTFINKGSS